MNRRDTVLALAALGASPVLCNAQQPKMPMIGLLGSESPVVRARHMRAFHEGLSELGYVDGRNVAIEYRWADGHNDRLPALALRHRVPAVYHFREFAAAGGLITYGGSIADAFRETGVYTGRILKGEKPANLPIQQVTKVDLYVNLKTAQGARDQRPQHTDRARGRGDRVTDRGRTGRVARRTGVGPVPPRTEVWRRSDAASRNAGKDCHEHGGARWDDSQ